MTDADLQGVFTRVPLLTMFGDFFGADVDDWPGRMAECVNTVNRIKTVGGTAENMYLPDAGIRGNSHMLMMDVNNQQLAGMILAWLNRNAPRAVRECSERGFGTVLMLTSYPNRWRCPWMSRRST